MSVDRGLKRIRLDHDSKEVESEGDREAQQQELRNKRNKIASDILRREAMVADNPSPVYLSRAMQLEGSIVGDVGECPKKNIPTQLLNAVLSGISVALRAGVVTVPELKQEILNFVYHYGRKMKAGLIKDDVTKSLIDDIDESLSKGIRHGSMPHACISLASSLWKISGYIGREYIRPVIEQKWNDIIDNYNQNKRAIEWANEQETEMGDMEASRLEDENRAAQVTLLTLGFEVEDNTEDAMESGNNPMQTDRQTDGQTDGETDPNFAIGRNMGPQMTRKDRAAFQRARNKRRIQMATQQRLAALQRDAAMTMAEEDSDAESSDPESLGGKRRTRKHKKQMKHKKTKRHRKNTKKHLKKRNNKKQRKTRNRK
jgi:hypothetical protein